MITERNDEYTYKFDLDLIKTSYYKKIKVEE
jgi:hypothetical protein